MPYRYSHCHPRRRGAGSIILLALAVLVAAGLGGCGSRPSSAGRADQPPSTTNAALHRFDRAKFIMGMWVRLAMYAPDEQTASAAADAAFARVIEIDRICSDYKIDSELNRLCRRAGQGPQPISPDLIRVLARAQEVAEQTGGAFDATAAPLVQLWRTARKSKSLPTPEQIASAKALVGWRNLRLDAEKRTAELLRPGMRLDLGAIAKGYAGDCAMAVLRQRGINRALFEAGGDVVIGDPPPGCRGWEIDVPFQNSQGQNGSVTAANCAVSVSGDLTQFVEIGAKRYSHVVDPRTGLGLSERWLALVVAPDGMTADSLATAATIAGRDRAQALTGRHGGTSLRMRQAE